MGSLVSTDYTHVNKFTASVRGAVSGHVMKQTLEKKKTHFSRRSPPAL